MSEEEKKEVEQPEKKDDDSSIKMIRRQLYSRKESDELKKRTDDLTNPPQPKFKAVRGNARPGLVNIVERSTKKRAQILKWSGIIGGILVVFGLAVGGTLWFRNSRQVSADNIRISVSAPSDFMAGEEITYDISYTNESNVNWQNVEMIFTPPDGFRYISSSPEFQLSERQYVVSLGSLNSGQGGVVQVTGQLLGQQDAVALAGVEVTVSPENFPKARISNTETVITIIASVPLDISVEANEDAADGERMSAVIRMRNLGSSVLEDMVLKLTASPGLQLAVEDTGFSPDFSVSDSWWELPVVEPLGEVERFVAMYVDGQPGDKRTLDVEFYVRDGDELILFSKASHVVTISESELVVSQLFNGHVDDFAVNAQEEIDGVVTYKNAGTSGLTDVIVTVAFEGVGLDPASINLKSGGAYDPIAKTITWSAASVPALSTLLPGQGGQFEYSFSSLSSDQIMGDESGKNPAIVAVATVDSPDLPTPVGQARQVVSDRFMMLINSSIVFDIGSFYDDGRLGLVSEGPLPPEVGQQTTYTIRFQLGATINDVGDVRMRAVFPDGVKYTGQHYATVGDVEVNDRSGEIFWTIPLIERLTGTARPTFELHVQVGITPGENVRGDVVEFLNVATVSGTDIFTDSTITTEASERQLPDTRDASPQNGKVK